LNLTLKAREACGIAVNQWFSLATAKEKIGKISTTLILERLLKHASTNLTKNGGGLPSHSGSHSLIARMTSGESGKSA